MTISLAALFTTWCITNNVPASTPKELAKAIKEFKQSQVNIYTKDICDAIIKSMEKSNGKHAHYANLTYFSDHKAFYLTKDESNLNALNFILKYDAEDDIIILNEHKLPFLTLDLMEKLVEFYRSVL